MDLLNKYFSDLDYDQEVQFGALEALYSEWNLKINVISRKDITNFYEHHVLHSLSIAKAIQFLPGSRILDIGTGGGFPGLPLAILYPQSNFLLVDSVGKKLKVIDDVVSKLGLKNVTTLQERAENVPGHFDFITSRAVTRLDIAWGWVSNKIAADSKHDLPNGMLYLKGGDISGETPQSVLVSRFELADWYSEPYFAEKSLIHMCTNVRK